MHSFGRSRNHVRSSGERRTVHIEGCSEVKACHGSFSAKVLVPGLIDVYVKIVMSQHEMRRLKEGTRVFSAAPIYLSLVSVS